MKETITATPHHTPAALPRPSRWIAKNVLAMERTKSRPLSRPKGVKTCLTDFSHVAWQVVAHIDWQVRVDHAADSLWEWLQALLPMK